MLGQEEHNLRLDFFDENDFIASYPLPTFVLTPALQVPRVDLPLNAGSMLQTGEECEIVRNFSDETGPRYGETGVQPQGHRLACLIPIICWIALHGRRGL